MIRYKLSSRGLVQTVFVHTVCLLRPVEEEEEAEEEVEERRSCTVGVVSEFHATSGGKASQLGTVCVVSAFHTTLERFAAATPNILCWHSTHLLRGEELQLQHYQDCFGVPHDWS